MGNYELVSLQLDTIFDTPAPTATLPAVVDKTSQHLIAIIDGAVRAPHRMARIVRPVSLVGMRVDRPDRDLVVSVELLVDEQATYMWQMHDEGRLPSLRRNKDLEPDLPDVSGRHRLLVFSAQGAPVAGAVLGLRPRDGDAVRETITFRIPADLVDEEGLVTIGVDSSRADREWGDEHRLADGAVGVAIVRVRIEPAGDQPIPAQVAVGRHDDRGALVTGETGFFVVNPGAPDRGYTIELSVRGHGGDRLRGRRARVKHPLRAVRELAQDARLDLSGGVQAEVRDLAGEPVSGCQVSGGQIRVPAGVGPVMVRPIKGGSDGTPMLVDWSVRVNG